MPKRTLRASATALPNTTHHPDADLLALAEKAAKASQLRDKALDMLDAAEDRLVTIEAPVALMKTEEDFKMRLFVGDGVGEVFDREEIRAVGVLRRRLGCDLAAGANLKAFKRCEDLLEAWKSWSESKELEEARSGYAAAHRADLETLEVYEGIASLLAQTRAVTMDGLLAKTRVFKSVFSAPDYLATSIREGLEKFGVADECAIALSLVRDIIVLAGAQAEEAA
jgi:hypothetical protein